MKTITMPARRRWLRGIGLGMGALAGSTPLLARQTRQAALWQAPAAGAAPDLPALPGLAAGGAAAGDEAYWQAVAAQYSVQPDLLNLENGYYGIMARPVLAHYLRNVTYLNERNSVYLRQDYEADEATARARVASALGVRPDEIALTRGATEALQILIGHYRGLKPGDTVLYADLDYDSAQQEFGALAARRGVRAVRFALPEPATRQAVLDAYAQALQRHPRTRLLLLTHVSNKTGLQLPLAELTRMARAHGADAIVDAAHSFGQVDVDFAAQGVDFAAFNLHKWIGAPLGVGFIYIRKERLRDIAPHLPDGEGEDDIASRVHTGTTNTANVMTVAAALDFHQHIGIAAKAARLRYLRDYWVSRVRGLPGLQVLTSDEPGMVGAITSFRLAGHGGTSANQALAARLRTQYGIFTVQRGGVAGGDCVRVTPALFTRPADLDRLVAALGGITRQQG